MLKHYLTMAMRSFGRDRRDTFINVFGLSTGISCCLILLLFVRYELGYDRWLPEAERTYQLQLSLDDPESEPVHLQMAPYPAAAALAADFAQVESAAGSFTARPVILHQGTASLPERDALMADSSFFETVAIPFVRGDRRRALADANSVVLSESEGRRYFGSSDPLGKVLTILHRGVRRDMRVTGVFADLPPDSHLGFPMVFGLSAADYADEPGLLASWGNISGYVYVKLRPGADAKALNAQLDAWERRHVPVAAGETRREGDEVYRLTAASDVHLGRNQTAAMRPGSDSKTLATYAAIGILILVLAAFNFVSLSTARASRRAREVGVRKVLGATRGQLLAMFFTESMLLVGVAMLAALAAVELALPAIGELVGAHLELTYFGRDGLWLHILGLTAATAVLGAAYPAFYLTRFEPARVLKANRAVTGTSGTGAVRSTLATAQFSVVIGFLVCTAVIYAQTAHSRAADLGFEREGLLRIDNLDRDGVRPVARGLIEELRRLQGVEAVGSTDIAPATGNVSATTAFLPGRAEPATIGLYEVDEQFLDALGTRMVAGRRFSRAQALDDSTLPATSDSAAERRLAERGINIVLSARGAERLGFDSPEAAVGADVRLGFIDEAAGTVPAKIVGVAEDVRYRSLREEVEPIAYRMVGEGTRHLVLRYSTPDPEALLGQIRSLWRARAPEVPFEAVFVEDALAGMYDRDAARGHLFAASSVLAIAIGCLGLFGLAAFMTERRTLEIGLRKLFGARVADIVLMLVWQFSRPVLFANLIAWPVAWWTMRGWLNGFSDRIALSPAYFLAAAVLALAVAAGTVGGHALRVARAKPIEALRGE
jgi:putative ABC transport system permease protein